MLSGEEVSEIKQKLIEHIKTSFPAEQSASAIKQIESMNSEQLESFLEKNKILKNENAGESKNECVFCSIVSGSIKSVKLDENEKALAILEINPISKGHSMILSKEHTDKPPRESMLLAKKILKEIKDKFKPKKIELSKSKLFGHEVINILPVYGKENFNSERKPAKIEELEIVKVELEKEVKKEKVRRPRIKKLKEVFWLPKRIP